MISIVYITARKEPHFDWFKDSLLNQVTDEELKDIEIIMVDYWRKGKTVVSPSAIYNMTVTPPLPSPVQGEHKITKKEYFAPSAARNAGIVHAKGDYIVFVDDVSVLRPNWWERVKKAYNEGYIVFGKYEKLTQMVVENGIVTSYYESVGVDTREVTQDLTPNNGSWCYGCSFGAPTEILLACNGVDTLCDMIGSEDYQLGMRMSRLGVPMYYDRLMITSESHEAHTIDVVMERFDKETTPEQYYNTLKRFGLRNCFFIDMKRWDSSHLILDTLFQLESSMALLNHFDLRKLKEKAQRGEEIIAEDMCFPSTFWFDNTPLTDY
jgi:hypothetical protein